MRDLDWGLEGQEDLDFTYGNRGEGICGNNSKSHNRHMTQAHDYLLEHESPINSPLVSREKIFDSPLSKTHKKAFLELCHLLP